MTPRDTDPDRPFALRTRTAAGHAEVWDAIRGRWLVLTPEEEVRQRAIGYLTGPAGVPPGLIAQEYPLTLHGTARRADIVVHDAAGRPRMIVECKAPAVPLTREVLEQAARYNLVLGVRYLWITNGAENRCYRYHAEDHRFESLAAIPDFARLAAE